MSKKLCINLPNSVDVNFFVEPNNLYEAARIFSSLDFIKETEIMKKVRNFPPFNLLIYDEFMALGLYNEKGVVGVGIRDYCQEGMIEWIDMALSLRKHPIRVVEKTSNEGEMFKRISSRMNLPWIEYDKPTQVIREISGARCPIDDYLESAPISKELYSLVNYDGQVHVAHKKINDNHTKFENGKHLDVLLCEDMGIEIIDSNLDAIELFLRKENPDALIIHEPLTYCGMGCKEVPYSCLAAKFEKWYAKKIGFFKEENQFHDA